MFTKIVHNKDLYYVRLNKDNLEEAIVAYLDSYLGANGNPMLKTIQMTRKEGEDLIRPRLTREAEVGKYCFIWYYKGKIAHFLLCWDLQDQGVGEPSHPNPLIEFKLKLDKRLLDTTKEKYNVRGKQMYCLIGSLPENGFPQLSQLASVDLMCHLNCTGYDGAGSLSYNPKSVSILVRNGGFVVCDIPND